MSVQPTIRIVHLISDLHTGGAQAMIYKVVTHMNPDRFENVVVGLTGEGVIGQKLEAAGIRVHYLHMQRGIPNPAGIFRLWLILRRERPVILQTWLYHADLLGFIAGKLARAPYLLWNVRQSSMDMAQYKQLSRVVIRALAWLSPYPNAVLVNSQQGLEAHAKIGYQPKQWELVHNGFDLQQLRPNLAARETFRHELGLPVDTPLIGLIARYDPMKDHATFVKAALTLLETHPSVHFVLIGPDVDKHNLALAAPIRAAGKAINFHLLGERQDIIHIMPALDIYTSSSAFGEGFSNSIGEAMACGVPCVVTNVGGSAFIVGDTGSVISACNHTAMTTAWTALLDNPERRAQLGQAARQRMETHFAIEKIADRYAKIYETLVASSPRSTAK